MVILAVKMPIPRDPIKATLWKQRQSKAQKGKPRNKGKDNPFYGETHSKKTKKRISNSLRGEKNPNFGKKRPQYILDAISRTHKGKTSPFKGKTYEEIYGIKKAKQMKKQISDRSKGNKYRTGKKHTKETKKKISIITRQRTPKGENHLRWKGGNGRCMQLYTGIGYKAWRKDVFERDNYTCRKCNDNKGGNLEAHHKITFKECLEKNNGLEFNVDNGTTLCKKCHRKEHAKKP